MVRHWPPCWSGGGSGYQPPVSATCDPSDENKLCPVSIELEMMSCNFDMFIHCTGVNVSFSQSSYNSTSLQAVL